MALAALFASLPLSSKLFLGAWDFQGASELACLCLIAAVYFHLASRSPLPSVPDTAAIMDHALQLAGSGRSDEAIVYLTEAIHLSPRVWQAFQYRGELWLQRNDGCAALEDFAEAIRLAPGEAHLYLLRGHAHSLLGHEAAAGADLETAIRLGRP